MGDSERQAVAATGPKRLRDRRPEPEPEPEPTPTDEGAGNSTSTAPSSGTPTPKIPTGILKPRDDSWSYLRSHFSKPNAELGLELLVRNNTVYTALSEPRGNVWEHWGFWPASRNSSRAIDYRARLNITSDLYILYNRGLVQLPNSTSPTTEGVNDQQGWWWLEENPNGGVYIKGGLYGSDYAYSMSEVGEEEEQDIYRFEANWNRTMGVGEGEAEDGKLRDGQIWKLELAFKFLEGEKGFWDSPATVTVEGTAVASASATGGP